MVQDAEGAGETSPLLVLAESVFTQGGERAA